MNPTQSSAGYPRRRLVLLTIACVLFSWNLWSYDLWAPDEPYFGEGAREMLDDGEWLVPHINGEVDNHKPPLFFWLIALFSWPLGGVSSFTARLPSVLAALITVAATMHMARRTAGERAALLAGTVLVTSYLFWDKARTAQIDSVLCCFITLALAAFCEFRSGHMSGRKAGMLFWAACALGVLAKGPVGLLIPLGTVVVALSLERSLKQWRDFSPIAGPLLFTAIAMSWVLAPYFWPQPDYSLLAALREHFLERGLKGMHHPQPFWYYATVLPWALFPWTFLLPGAFLHVWPIRIRKGVLLALVHAAFVVLFFSVSTEKRDLYILPALPALAIILALFLDFLLGARPRPVLAGRPMSRRWLSLPQAVVATVLILLGIAVPLVAQREYPGLMGAAIALTIALLCGGSWILYCALRGRSALIVRSTACSMAVLLLVATTFLHPALNPKKSARGFAGQVVKEVARFSEAEVLVVTSWNETNSTWDNANVVRSIGFYSKGLYPLVIEPDELPAFLEDGRPLLVVVDRHALGTLKLEPEPRMIEIYEERLSRKDFLLLKVLGRES